MKKKFFIIIFFICGLAQESLAYSSDPKQFIQAIVDEAKKILVDSNTKEFKTKKLSEMALKTVDIKGVAYYSLGHYRKELINGIADKECLIIAQNLTKKM